MKPIEFEEQNVIYAKDQPQYQPLPALKENDTTITCWELSEEDKKILNETGVVWLSQMNFGSPLQPVLMTVNKSELI